MLLDLLSMDNYVSYNIKVAEILGLHPAIYLSELMNINDKAIKKSKTKQNYFTVDRSYITRRTTLSKEEQLKIDQQLFEIGLLKPNSDCKDTVTLDIAVLTSMLAGNETVIKDLKKIVKNSNPKPKCTKIQQIQNVLQATVMLLLLIAVQFFKIWNLFNFTRLLWL